jgi:hypothetical protein
MKLHKKLLELLLPAKNKNQMYPCGTQNWIETMCLWFLELELEFEFCEKLTWNNSSGTQTILHVWRIELGMVLVELEHYIMCEEVDSEQF